MEREPLPIDFRHLETFCRLAERRSFSKAADDLFLTQPTVSGHILFLEKVLGLRLFDRTGRDVRLTKAGEIFLRYATKILGSRKELLNALSEFSEGLRGELSMGASTIPGEHLLPRLIGGFRREHPHHIISLKIADTKEIVRDLMDGMVELAMTGARLPHPSLSYEKYEEDEIIPVAPSGHPLAGKKGVNLESLLQEPWIVREEGSGTQMAVELSLRKKGKSLKDFHVVMEMGSTSALKEGVKAGLGLAFLSRWAAEEELVHGVLSPIHVREMDPIPRSIYLVTRRGKTLSPIGSQFLRFLRIQAERKKDGPPETK